MNHLIARVDAPEEIRAFPLRLQRELRQLHAKYYRLTFYKAGIFGDAVPSTGGVSYGGTGDGYGVVLSPRFNHIGICWDTSRGVFSGTDAVYVIQYIDELLDDLLARYGYSPTAANPLRKIHISTIQNGTFSAMIIEFGVPNQFYRYDI